MSANTNPILPCEENEVVRIALTSIKEANLKNDFIPIVKLDKTYKENGFKYTDSNKKATLSPYIEEKDYALESVMFDDSEEFVLRFEIKKGNSAADDNRGFIHAIGRGVSIISKTELNIKYDQKVLLRISKKDIKSGAYIDFYANDNDWKYYSVSNVHCGRVSIMQEYSNINAIWMDIAIKELGVTEIKGSKHNPRVIEYHATTGKFKNDETPWCSSFVNWCITQANLKGTNSAAAFSWRKYGKKLSKPAFGAIAIMTYSHVGFVAGINSDGRIVLLGGNQGDAVNLSPNQTTQVEAYVYPNDFEPNYDLPKYNLKGKSLTASSSR